MKFYLLIGEIKRLTISNFFVVGIKVRRGSSGAGFRWCSSRNWWFVVFMFGFLLPVLFVRNALFVLESSSVCDSTLDCIKWSIFRAGNASALSIYTRKLGRDLSKALLEAKDGNRKEGFAEGSLETFDELVKETTSKEHDIKAFVIKTKSMLLSMERKIQTARHAELTYWHLASHGIPKSLSCLYLHLATEYTGNAKARSHLPPPEHIFSLVDPSFRHIVLLTDNVLAASVVVSSTLQNARKPNNLVFHIVTDKKTYNPMHAWFATNSIASAIVEVIGLHQNFWSEEINIGITEALEINRLIWTLHNKKIKDSQCSGEYQNCLDALSLSSWSIMSHLQIYIHELFPSLKKVVLLDDDVVVQHDISSLWDIDLNGKVVGAVFVESWCGENCCQGRRYKDYLNFSKPVIASHFNNDRCTWLSGMNVFDLEAWRRSDITAIYQNWLKINLHSGLQLWKPGAFPPALLALEGHVHPLDPIWHVAGLGYRFQKTSKRIMETAAVVHFSGPAKPWLEIGSSEVRHLWSRYVNASNKFIRKCRVQE